MEYKSAFDNVDYLHRISENIALEFSVGCHDKDEVKIEWDCDDCAFYPCPSKIKIEEGKCEDKLKKSEVKIKHQNNSKKRNGMGGHQCNKMLSDEWLTPPEIISDLGPFDLDPCSPISRPWNTAKKHFTIEDNGLLQEWNGLVWCNPPYGAKAEAWLNRMALHNNGIALVFARTETRSFFRYVWPFAKSILFIKGRLSFYRVDGEQASFNGGAPSVLIAYGERADLKLQRSEITGKYVRIN